MSENSQATAPTTLDPKVVYVPIAYDPEPARRRRARRRGATGRIRHKPYRVGPRGGIAWVGSRKLRYDPEPARRRRRVRRLDPIRGATGRTLVDGALDGVAWGWIASKVPLEQSLGPVTAKELIAAGGALAYEKFFMKRGWLVALISAGIAYATKRWLAP